jgi:hypothetical protein
MTHLPGGVVHQSYAGGVDQAAADAQVVEDELQRGVVLDAVATSVGERRGGRLPPVQAAVVPELLVYGLLCPLHQWPTRQAFLPEASGHRVQLECSGPIHRTDSSQGRPVLPMRRDCRIGARCGDRAVVRSGPRRSRGPRRCNQGEPNRLLVGLVRILEEQRGPSFSGAEQEVVARVARCAADRTSPELGQCRGVSGIDGDISPR